MLCVLVRVLRGARWQRHIAEANTVSHLLNIHICPESRAVAILADACSSSIAVTTPAPALHQHSHKARKSGRERGGMSFMSTLSLKSTIEEAWVREILGKYQLYPSNLLLSPLTKKLPRILWGKIEKGRRAQIKARGWLDLIHQE